MSWKGLQPPLGVQLFELEGIIQHFPVMLNYTMGTPVIKV